MRKPLDLMTQPHLRIAHLHHRLAQLPDRIQLRKNMSRRLPQPDRIHLGKHAMGLVVAVGAIDAVVDDLLVDALVGEAHHGRDQLAVFPVGVALVLEHVRLCGVALQLGGEGGVGEGEGGGDVFVLDDEGGDVEAEVGGGGPGHGAVLEDGAAEGAGFVGALVGVAEHEGADYHGALGFY